MITFDISSPLIPIHVLRLKSTTVHHPYSIWQLCTLIERWCILRFFFFFSFFLQKIAVEPRLHSYSLLSFALRKAPGCFLVPFDNSIYTIHPGHIYSSHIIISALRGVVSLPLFHIPNLTPFEARRPKLLYIDSVMFMGKQSL